MNGTGPPKSGPAAPANGRRYQWATSKKVGRISELVVMAPIRRGGVPGERRTFEERLRATIANIAKRHEQGYPTELDRVSTIHFGRMIVIRPDQYLDLSAFVPDEDPANGKAAPGIDSAPLPDQIDDFKVIDAAPAKAPARGTKANISANDLAFRSWLLVLVVFDGDLKVYMRDIAQFVGKDFDNIFRNCEDYSETKDFENFWAWIRRFQIPTDFFYAAYPDLSVARLKQLEMFKRRFDAFVARVRSPRGPIVSSMDEMFDEFLRQNQQYADGFPSPSGIYASADDQGGG